VSGGAESIRLAQLLGKDLAALQTGPADTYGSGKHLGKIASLIPIAEQYGLHAEAQDLTRRLKQELESWLVAVDASGKPKSTRLFAYDKRWTALTGYPASFGSDVDSDDKWGGMIKLIARDIASASRKDRLFPFLRNFDPYAGHSWASGHARFGDGNNNESSSEAMNAWYGMILFGEFTKDDAMRDLGIWLYTTEMAAIEDYWFGVHGDTFATGYTPSVVTMVWGGKGANATWFSAAPEAIHGINFLPITGGSLYLGRFPQYVDKNWQAMLAEKNGTPFKQWEDVLLMYRALSDPADALSRFDAAAAKGLKPEDGNTLTNTYHWIATLKVLGTVDRTVPASSPLSAVFVKDGKRTRVTYDAATRWTVKGE
jgi:endoglucanase Acf2